MGKDRDTKDKKELIESYLAAGNIIEKNLSPKLLEMSYEDLENTLYPPKKEVVVNLSDKEIIDAIKAARGEEQKKTAGRIPTTGMARSIFLTLTGRENQHGLTPFEQTHLKNIKSKYNEYKLQITSQEGKQKDKKLKDKAIDEIKTQTERARQVRDQTRRKWFR